VPDEPGITPEAAGALPDFDELRRHRARLVVEVDPASLLYVVAGVVVAVLVLGFFRAAPAAFTQVAVGVLLGLALNPLVLAVQRRTGCRRSIGVVAVGAALLTLFLAIGLFLGPPAVEQGQRFTRELPQTVRDFYDLPVIGHRLEEADAATRVQDWINELPARLDDETVGRYLDRAVGGVATALTIGIVAFAVLLDGERLVARIRRLVPPSARDEADWIGRVVYRTLGNYFSGSLLVAILNGVVVLTAGLALGVPLAPLAAIWSTVTNLIPQVGGLLGGSFFVLLAFTQGPIVGLVALGIFLGYQQLENHVIQPAVVGQAVNLSPLTTMVAALVGAAAAGVPGALIATPLVGAAKVLYLEFRAGREGRPPPERPTSPLRWPWRRQRHPEKGPPSGTGPPGGQ
jgi:predicted PurR-regulated permease PerM